MNYYTRELLFHCGVNLHTRSMYICLLDQSGQIVLHRKLESNPQHFLDVIAPFHQDIFVCAATIKTNLSYLSTETEIN